MSEPNTRRTSGLWAVVAVLLAVGIVVPLLVGLYDSVEPRLGGFPFYYWFQLALIPVSVVLMAIAYYIARGADILDREAHGTRRGETPR